MNVLSRIHPMNVLNLFNATRPEEPSPDAWEETLTRIAAALLAECIPPESARPVQARPALVATGNGEGSSHERHPA
jgi:hypothetical protein